LADNTREIQFTLKIRNDPANTFAAAEAARLIKASSATGIPDIKAQSAAMAEQAAAYRATTLAAKAAAAESAARSAAIKAETAAIQQQIVQEKLRQVAIAKSAAVSKVATVGGAAGFFSGLGAGTAAKSGVGETARLNSEGSLRLNLFSRLNAFVDLAIAGIIGNKILEVADKFAELTGKIKINTETEGEANAVRQRLVELSLRTHSSLESQVEIWEKLVQVGRTYHKSQNDILQIQETLFKGLRMGGASGERASSAMMQFVTILNRGRASAMGFNAIFHQSPELMNMLAKAMDKPLNAFTSLSKKSRVSMTEIVEGIKKIAPEVEAKLAQLPVTMRDGFQDTKTAFDVMIGEIGEKMKISGGIGSFFEKLAMMFRDPKFKEGIVDISNAIGGVLLHALDLLTKAMAFLESHGKLVSDTLSLLGYYLEFKLAKGLIAGIFAFGKFNAAGELVAGKMGLIQKLLRDLAVVGMMPINAMSKLAGVFTTTGAAATEAAVATEGLTAATAESGIAAGALGGPWGMVAAAIILAAGAAYQYSDAIDASGNHTFTLADVGRGAWQQIKEDASSAGTWISDHWTGLVNWFTGTAWPAIAQAAKDAALNSSGAFGDAAKVTLSAWNLMPDAMQGIFAKISNAASNAAKSIGNSLGHDLMVNFRSAVGTGVNALLPGAGLFGGLLKGMPGAIQSAGEEGRRIRARKELFAPGWREKAIADMHAGDVAKLLDKPLTGGAPLGTDAGKEKKAKQDNRLADAIQGIKDYIKQVEQATKDQNLLNAAMLAGPAAERAQQAQTAYDKTKLDETTKIQKASVKAGKDYQSVVLTTAQAELVEKAAMAAKNLELSKQRGERDKLTRGIKDQTNALKDQIAITKIGFTAFTQDASLRRQQILDIAEQTARQEKLNEFKKQEYSQLSDHRETRL
jgi:tape measure domain-containing protein